jgi:rhodanese-related sulfurtransferase
LELRNAAARQRAEVDRALDEHRPKRRNFTITTVEELGERIAREETVLLDVRPEVEFAGHLPGAVSIPLDAIEQRYLELPAGSLIGAYCRGPYCVFADEALAFLKAKGWEVARLEEGVAEWQLAGFNLERKGGIKNAGKTVRRRRAWQYLLPGRF